MALMAVLTLFIGACGGGDDDDSSSTGSAATGATGATGATAATGATGATAGTGSTGAPSTGSTGSGQSLADLADLTGLGSFRWDVTLAGAGEFLGAAGVPTTPGGDDSEFTASGSYIAPDQAQVTISVSGLEYKQTVKGNQQWTTIAGVTTGPVAATSDAQSLIYVSSFVDPESVAGGSMDCGDRENVNGVAAVRCETNDEVNQQIVAGLAGTDAEANEASFVIWVAEAGNFIVKWEFNAEGEAAGGPFEWSFKANITDVNNVSAIQP